MSCVIDARRLVVKRRSPAATRDRAVRPRAGGRCSALAGAVQAAGLTAAQAATTRARRPAARRRLEPAAAKRADAAPPTIGTIVMFVLLTQYLTWTLIGVMEEKSSRVVEVLLATLRPMQLLAGKVVGIAAVVFAQAARARGVRARARRRGRLRPAARHGAAGAAQHAGVAAARLCVLLLALRRGRVDGRAAGSGAEPGAAAGPADDRRLHPGHQRGEFGHAARLVPRARLPAAHRPVRDDDARRARRGDLVAVHRLGA